LLLFASQKWNWRAIHAPVFGHLTNRDLLKAKCETLLGILNGSIKKYDIPNVRPLNNAARKCKTITGQLIGGNLTILELGFGTCWEIQPRGKILFTEDVNVAPWRIFRSLYHLQESGKLDGVKAIVLGDFTKSGASQKEIAYALRKFAEGLNIPVYVTNQFGHGDRNMPIIYNAQAVLHDGRMTINVE
jgi:muramoyltetrapeptide carboxypeptidase